MMDLPKLVLSNTSVATTYHFRCEPRDLGWALCTVNDTTGELLVQSDWGSWSHRWSPDPKHLGAASLTHFIADRNACHYLADKLCKSDEAHSFDADETVKVFRRRLAERRLEEGRAIAPRRKPYKTFHTDDSPLTADIAREVFDELDRLRDLDRHVDLFIDRFFRIRGCTWVTEEPWEMAVYTPTPGYIVLRDAILPALVEACRVRVGKPGTEARA